MNWRYCRKLARGALLIALAGVTGGCKAQPPGKLETAVITRTKHWVSVHNRNTKNPLAATSEHIADGKESFSHYCVA